MTLTQPDAHTDRRVLDPTQRAHLAHHNGGYRVSAGEGFLVFNDSPDDVTNYDAAYMARVLHNTMNGFDDRIDRRAS